MVSYPLFLGKDHIIIAMHRVSIVAAYPPYPRTYCRVYTLLCLLADSVAFYCVCVCGMVAIITIVYVYKGGYILVRVCMCMLVSCCGYAEEMTCLSDQHVVYWIFYK